MKKCESAAIKILNGRRELARLAESLRYVSPETALELAREIELLDQVRIQHAATGCKCWQAAIFATAEPTGVTM